LSVGQRLAAKKRSSVASPGPSYITASTIATRKLDYEWDVRTSSQLLGSYTVTRPKLFKALGTISIRAAYGLALAASEWVLARSEPHIDVSDGLARLEAAWASTVDLHYADLGDPLAESKADPRKKLDPSAPTFPWAGPVWLAVLVIASMHRDAVSGRSDRIRDKAYIALSIAQHVCGRDASYKAWLTDALDRARSQHKARRLTMDKEAPIAREWFTPGAKLDAKATKAAQTELLASLDPKRNTYVKR
jgi:hypothetical protein